MKRILLVDDIPEELGMLNAGLTASESDWQVDCAHSGAAALQKILDKPYDVVVADLVMPLMDGEHLLKEVRRQCPQTVRILVSGHFEWSSASRLLNTAHQFIGKPCSATELEETIRRSLFLRDLLANKHLNCLIAQTQSLPSLPSLYLELLDELGDSEPSTHHIARIVARDLGMSAKLLQLANSAFFGLSQKVCSIEEAVFHLGVETVKALVLSLQVFAHFASGPIQKFSFDQLWNHSWKTGQLAKQLCQEEQLEAQAADEAFTAGLLHDVGKLVLVTALSKRFREAFLFQQQHKVPYAQAERTVFGCTHAEVGAYLLGLWGLPNPIVEAVALHHRPADCTGSGFSIVTAVHLADALDHRIEPQAPRSDAAELDTEYLAQLGLTDRYALWHKQTQELSE